MFNGIIFNKGTINEIKKRQKGVNLFVKSSLKVSNTNLGISISCDGVCLTLISYQPLLKACVNQMYKVFE